jgi:AcrR family transcriptional regulator
MRLNFTPCRLPSAQRGEETRRRILEAAIETFASVGYDAAHTRLLAERANIKLPAISYYFGSKEGLFAAAIEHIAGQFEQHMAAVGERVQAVLADPAASRPTVLSHLCELLDTFAETMLSPAFPESWRLMIVRAEIANAEALEPMHENIRRLVVRPVKDLIARLCDPTETKESSWMRAAAILGQINIFCKPQVRQGLGWGEYTEEQSRAIRAIVHEHVRAIFDHGRTAQ